MLSPKTVCAKYSSLCVFSASHLSTVTPCFEWMTVSLMAKPPSSHQFVVTDSLSEFCGRVSLCLVLCFFFFDVFLQSFQDLHSYLQLSTVQSSRVYEFPIIWSSARKLFATFAHGSGAVRNFHCHINRSRRAPKISQSRRAPHSLLSRRAQDPQIKVAAL